MLRILVVIVIAVAALWYFTRDAGTTAKIAEAQREDLETARAGAEMAEMAAAADAVRSDAARDAAMGVLGDSGETGESGEAQGE